ncbi:MAG TPA: 3-hydroxyacyl-CoA dehydrogenase family protein [Sedimentisphaerales bacterium]|nr:3-hydroxyacyl-CoA dehydrogenase family protein [Sedimentisphaerales bacterium]
MIDTIKNVVVLGASGTVGSLTGGLIAQNGIKVYFLSRTADGSKRGLERAVAAARSEVIARNIVCGDYQHLLAEALKEADWILEAVAEKLEVKRQLYEKIQQYKRPGSIVSTTTSSLPLTQLAKGWSADFRTNFLSTHFYNPPGRMLACEIAATADTDPQVLEFMTDFLKTKLRRVIVPVRNVAGFAGNRIAFLLFSRITVLAQQYGVELMDYLIGPYTGRLMPPLATLDLVGLDIHKAIIESLSANTNDEMHNQLVVPDYLERMLDKGLLGRKTGAGFYKKLESGKYVFFDPETCDYIPAIQPHVSFVEKARHFIHMGMYRNAFDVIKSAAGPEAEIVTDLLCTYIAYSFARIGDVVDPQAGIDAVDSVMSSGFNWAPPSVMVSMLGGKKAVVELLEKRGFIVPLFLRDNDVPHNQIPNFGKYFIAR